MKLILGKKLNMSQKYSENGSIVPVTIVKVGKGAVVQVKGVEKHGKNASVQLGFKEGSKHVNKAIKGQVKGLVDCPRLIEMQVQDTSVFEAGQIFGLDSFSKGEKVSVSALSKGRGYQGVVKRHGFHGSKKTHGAKHSLRSPGSIGSTDAARVFPGKRMAGRMGGTRITVSNLEIVDIDLENELVMIKGAVPGARNGVVEIRAEGDLKMETGQKKKEQEKISIKDEKEEIKK
ncbi:MAG: 50S ribosomal protein L3 [Parcubacteria group bacterium CG_4_9_14_0_2_um_filter_41_8]|nr:MAG: 50S ribosomal protein L3 [Parcubacteria group bacterium CG_4_10_14_0_2_um_filter_41_6]PJC40445.1 MAG: 50S ribosomal protein L3 [Parcubacteria group bacterium CG_4_9_14_0_2_um_filter_41_8]